jgi:hypothetical protein
VAFVTISVDEMMSTSMVVVQPHVRLFAKCMLVGVDMLVVSYCILDSETPRTDGV